VALGNGTTTHYAYDVQGRLTNIAHRKSDGSLFSGFSYTHDEGTDNKGWRTSMTRTFESGATETTSYDYDDLLEYAKNSLVKYKVPRAIEFIDSLPRQDNGKLYKKKLKDKYWADKGRQI